MVREAIFMLVHGNGPEKLCSACVQEGGNDCCMCI